MHFEIDSGEVVLTSKKGKKVRLKYSRESASQLLRIVLADSKASLPVQSASFRHIMDADDVCAIQDTCCNSRRVAQIPLRLEQVPIFRE